MDMTKADILKRIEIEDVRIANADKNISALIVQKTKSMDEQVRLQALYEALPSEEPAGV